MRALRLQILLFTSAVLLGCGSGLKCPEPVATFCDAGTCPSSLSDAPSVLCGPERVLALDCGTYRRVSQAGVDTATMYFFDRSSGALVAVVHSSVAGHYGETCQAGPSSFDEPICPNATPTTVACPDGGT